MDILRFGTTYVHKRGVELTPSYLKVHSYKEVCPKQTSIAINSYRVKGIIMQQWQRLHIML